MFRREILFWLMVLAVVSAGCRPLVEPDDDFDAEGDTLVLDESYWRVAVTQQVTGVQPGTGLVLWPERAAELGKEYGAAIALEFFYALPCKVVRGKEGGLIVYDWEWLESRLEDVQSRGHQAVVRFRYEYPGSREVDGTAGATAVPAYIKAMDGYEERFAENPNGDGPTYYADWRSEELRWFTKQFYSDFAEKYGEDRRIAFVEVGFGHWSEYHIFGTEVVAGVNFPSKGYQREFFEHLDQVMTMPYLVSIDAADAEFSALGSGGGEGLNFGLFDDSFMHEGHDLSQGEGYNEVCWMAMGEARWERGVCGGEISYYSERDQWEFLSDRGLYGVRWEDAAEKYHISFMIANDALEGRYGSADKFREAGMASGYRVRILDCKSNGAETQVLVTNKGVAPIYWDAYFAIDGVRSGASLKGLLPGEKRIFVIDKGLEKSEDLRIECDKILENQEIEFEGRKVR